MNQTPSITSWAPLRASWIQAISEWKRMKALTFSQWDLMTEKSRLTKIKIPRGMTKRKQLPRLTDSNTLNSDIL
jgi:hypothetical protein